MKLSAKAPYVYDYSIVALNSSFHLFGGFSPAGYSNVIASFDTVVKRWIKFGKLNQARQGHRVIIQQDEFVVVGGFPGSGTERCTSNGKVLECTVFEPDLFNYIFYPELMLVPANYCPK